MRSSVSPKVLSYARNSPSSSRLHLISKLKLIKLLTSVLSASCCCSFSPFQAEAAAALGCGPAASAKLRKLLVSGLSTSCLSREAACLWTVDKLPLKLLVHLLLWKLQIETTQMMRKLKLQMQRYVACSALQAMKVAIHAARGCFICRTKLMLPLRSNLHTAKLLLLLAYDDR